MVSTSFSLLYSQKAFLIIDELVKIYWKKKRNGVLVYHALQHYYLKNHLEALKKQLAMKPKREYDEKQLFIIFLTAKAFNCLILYK